MWKRAIFLAIIAGAVGQNYRPPKKEIIEEDYYADNDYYDLMMSIGTHDELDRHAKLGLPSSAVLPPGNKPPKSSVNPTTTKQKTVFTPPSSPIPPSTTTTRALTTIITSTPSPIPPPTTITTTTRPTPSPTPPPTTITTTTRPLTTIITPTPSPTPPPTTITTTTRPITTVSTTTTTVHPSTSTTQWTTIHTTTLSITTSKPTSTTVKTKPTTKTTKRSKGLRSKKVKAKTLKRTKSKAKKIYNPDMPKDTREIFHLVPLQYKCYNRANESLLVKYASSLCEMARLSELLGMDSFDERDRLFLMGNSARNYATVCSIIYRYRSNCKLIPTKGKLRPIKNSYFFGPRSSLFTKIGTSLACEKMNKEQRKLARLASLICSSSKLFIKLREVMDVNIYDYGWAMMSPAWKHQLTCFTLEYKRQKCSGV